MPRTLLRFWNDDRGAVIAVELILIVAILIFGLIAGLIALRNSIIAAFGTTGNILITTVPSFTYSGYSISNAFGFKTIAQVQGYQLQPNTAIYLTASQVPPIYLGTVAVIPPAT